MVRMVLSLIVYLVLGLGLAHRTVRRVEGTSI